MNFSRSLWNCHPSQFMPYVRTGLVGTVGFPPEPASASLKRFEDLARAKR